MGLFAQRLEARGGAQEGDRTHPGVLGSGLVCELPKQPEARLAQLLTRELAPVGVRFVFHELASVELDRGLGRRNRASVVAALGRSSCLLGQRLVVAHVDPRRPRRVELVAPLDATQVLGAAGRLDPPPKFVHQNVQLTGLGVRVTSGPEVLDQGVARDRAAFVGHQHLQQRQRLAAADVGGPERHPVDAHLEGAERPHGDVRRGRLVRTAWPTRFLDHGYGGVEPLAMVVQHRGGRRRHGLDEHEVGAREFAAIGPTP